MASVSNASRSNSRIALNRLWWVGLLATVGSVVANLIVLAIVLAVTNLTTAFLPLQPGAIGVLTAVGTLLAVIAFATVVRVSKQPIRTYWIVATVALLVSIVPNVLAAMGIMNFPMPNTSALGFYVLIIFHVVAAAVSVGVLTTLMQDK